MKRSLTDPTNHPLLRPERKSLATARPFSGKVHVGENRITRKNGITYVYERTAQQERKLLNWLNQRSLAQIFDWFDGPEETTVRTDAGIRRWSAESAARDRLFPELPGVSKS